MEKTPNLMIRIVGVFLSSLGAAIFCLLFVLWSVEEYSTYSVPAWPMAFGLGVAVVGLICVKVGMKSTHF